MVIEWPILINGLLSPAIAGLIGVVWYNRNSISKLSVELEKTATMLEKRFATAREERLTQIATTRDELKTLLNAYKQGSSMEILNIVAQLQSFQLAVAEKYVRGDALREFEARIKADMDQLNQKLDRIIERQNGSE